jgi:Lar family restriction alleviation protein
MTTNPEIALKPCPFCGSDAAHVFAPTCKRESPYNAGDRAFPEVRCPGCYATASGADWDQTGQSAIAAWNRRPPADAIISGPLQERVEELEGAVRIAAVAFRQYEALHLAKGTQDGDEKAQRNHELAARMEAALSHKEGEGNV